eukprot:4557302-Pleurochrysis_carterae.AAC.4
MSSLLISLSLSLSSSFSLSLLLSFSFSRPSGQRNVVFVDFDEPTTLSMVRIWCRSPLRSSKLIC